MRTQKRIHQLKITLEDTRPPIWRRVQVAEGTRLGQLHLIFQAVMGWENYHLHAFRVGDVTYGEPDPDYGDDWIEDERRVKLRDIAPEVGAKFRYEYDFGDSWQHKIQVEKILEAEPGVSYPLCIKGKRACPPEDCGGVWGYDRFLAIMSNPKHKEYEDMLEWAGGPFDPEAFDQNAINEALRQLH